MRQEVFIKNFSKAIQEGNAAVFAGAGTSVDAGFVNWKKLGLYTKSGAWKNSISGFQFLYTKRQISNIIKV